MIDFRTQFPIGSTKVQTLFECIESISHFIASNHFKKSISDIASSKVLGSSPMTSIFHKEYFLYFLHKHTHVPFKKSGDPPRSMRWQRNINYWLMDYGFLRIYSSRLFRDLLFEFHKLSLSPSWINYFFRNMIFRLIIILWSYEK